MLGYLQEPGHLLFLQRRGSGGQDVPSRPPALGLRRFFVIAVVEFFFKFFKKKELRLVGAADSFDVITPEFPADRRGTSIQCIGDLSDPAFLGFSYGLSQHGAAREADPQGREIGRASCRERV